MVCDNAKSTCQKRSMRKYKIQYDFSEGDKTYVYLKYTYYNKVVNCSITRIKEYLLGSHKNVVRYVNIRKAMIEEKHFYMKKTTILKHLSQHQFNNRIDFGSYYESDRSGRGSPSLSVYLLKGTR